jgi:hypothetical protein
MTALQDGDQVDFVCDGIAMGCKKHYLLDVEHEEPSDPTPIAGSKHADRYANADIIKVPFLLSFKKSMCRLKHSI